MEIIRLKYSEDYLFGSPQDFSYPIISTLDSVLPYYTYKTQGMGNLLVRIFPSFGDVFFAKVYEHK